MGGVGGKGRRPISKMGGKKGREMNVCEEKEKGGSPFPQAGEELPDPGFSNKLRGTRQGEK